MNADELLKKAIEYSADADGINDRFMGNAELYESCFMDFMEEPNFDLLRRALSEGDYAAAFSAAHALKGVSGNLGLSSFYNAICVLVESLRAKSYGNVEAESAEVERQLSHLQRLLTGEPLESEVSPGEGEAAGGDSEAQTAKRKRDLFIPVAVAVLLLVFVCVGLLFFRIFVKYRENITLESADHLVEINYQLKLYIEEKIENDWKIAASVGDNLADANYGDDDAAVFDMLLRKRAVWQVTDIMLYTESGYSICSDGDTESNDVASDTIVKAVSRGGYMSIGDSKIIYTLPVDTNITYGGSRIVAVSVVQSMKTFLDDMGFSSFDGQAWMYLADENGIVISKLTNEAAAPAFNFMAIANGREITALGGGSSAADILSVRAPTAFMMADDAGSDYVVSTPIFTRGAPMRLFYLAPVAVVNETMNGFSRQLLALSMCVVLVFAVLALMVFVLAYRVRKKQFDDALLARERMFDLLIKNTQTAFGLFTANRKEPVYISSNSDHVVGDRYFAIDRTDSGYRMRGSSDEDGEAIRQVNEAMRAWDGKGEFKSGYIRNDLAVPPNYFEIQLYPVDRAGKDFIGIARDVTQAYEREEATRTALEMAERANDAKSRFLSNMSHDIRTPMNAVVNMTLFAIESLNRPAQLKEYLQTILESSEHLLRLINDVLDMSRIESGQTVVESEPFDVKDEMKRQANIVKPLCMAKSLTLITDFDGIRTTGVRGDQLKFSQVIANLLSNAVKFTPRNGAVRFSAAEIPSLRDDIVDIRFTIEDNGIGMSEEYIRHIFEPFSRADDRRISRIEGTGLGLSICHSYVTAMGGVISCESEEGEGSVFTVELFFQKAAAIAHADVRQDAVCEEPFQGKRCLVVEDNSANQTIARMMLERLGFAVDIAEDGREGVKAFLRSLPGYYDIIYMDIQMPLMDGYQATVAIRDSEHPQAKTIPIVAMTANVFVEDIEKARIAGMNGHLGKPVMSYNLTEETYRVIGDRKE